MFIVFLIMLFILQVLIVALVRHFCYILLFKFIVQFIFDIEFRFVYHIVTFIVDVLAILKFASICINV